MDAVIRRKPYGAVEKVSKCKAKPRRPVKAARPLSVPPAANNGIVIVISDSEDEGFFPNSNHNVNSKAPPAEEHLRHFSPNDIFRDDVEDTQVTDEASQGTSANGVPPSAKITFEGVIEETVSYVRACRNDINAPTFSPNEHLQSPSTLIHDTNPGIADLQSTVDQIDSSNTKEYLQDTVENTEHRLDDSQILRNPSCDIGNNGLDANLDTIDVPHCRSGCMGLETGISSEAVPDQGNARTAVGAPRASLGPALVRFINSATDTDVSGEKGPQASFAPSTSFPSPHSLIDHIPVQDESVCQPARPFPYSKEFVSDYSSNALSSSKQSQSVSVLLDGDEVPYPLIGTAERRRSCSVCSKPLCLTNAYCKVACRHVSLPCCSTGPPFSNAGLKIFCATCLLKSDESGYCLGCEVAIFNGTIEVDF